MAAPNKLNLHQKLVEIQKVVDHLNKDGEGYGYKFATGAQLYSKIRSKMDDLGVLLQTALGELSHESFNYKNSKGQEKTDIIIKGPMTFTWINADDPKNDREIVPWYLYGQQAEASQALGSGLTYNERYFVLKYFHVPTDEDDPDTRSGQKYEQEHGKEPPKSPQNTNGGKKDPKTNAGQSGASNGSNGSKKQQDPAKKKIPTYNQALAAAKKIGLNDAGEMMKTINGIRKKQNMSTVEKFNDLSNDDKIKIVDWFEKRAAENTPGGTQ